MADTGAVTTHVRGLYSQCTYDFFDDSAVTVGLSEAALKELFGRIVLSRQDQRREHQHGSFEHLGHLDWGVTIVATTSANRVLMRGREVQVWLSAKSLSRLIAGCAHDLVDVLSLPGPGGHPTVTVIGERDGFHAARILWSHLPKGPGSTEQPRWPSKCCLSRVLSPDPTLGLKTADFTRSRPQGIPPELTGQSGNSRNGLAGADHASRSPSTSAPARSAAGA